MIPFAWIVDAKLVLTDELMKKGAEIRAARGDDDEDFENEDDFEDEEDFEDEPANDED